jgi:hypothetical protein
VVTAVDLERGHLKWLANRKVGEIEPTTIGPRHGGTTPAAIDCYLSVADDYFRTSRRPNYAEAANDTLAKAREAIAKGEQPTSATGLGVARECLDIIAKVMHRDAD